MSQLGRLQVRTLFKQNCWPACIHIGSCPYHSQSDSWQKISPGFTRKNRKQTHLAKIVTATKRPLRPRHVEVFYVRWGTVEITSCPCRRLIDIQPARATATHRCKRGLEVVCWLVGVVVGQLCLKFSAEVSRVEMSEMEQDNGRRSG